MSRRKNAIIPEVEIPGLVLLPKEPAYDPRSSPYYDFSVSAHFTRLTFETLRRWKSESETRKHPAEGGANNG